LPPEELLEEVVRLRLSAPISLLTRVRRSVDILFLKVREHRRAVEEKSVSECDVLCVFCIPLNRLELLLFRRGRRGEETLLLDVAVAQRPGGKRLQELAH